MKRMVLTGGLWCFLAAAALAAQPAAEIPRYVAVELSLDGAVRDAGVTGPDEVVGRRNTATGENHAIVLRGDREIDLHPAAASSSWAIAGILCNGD